MFWLGSFQLDCWICVGCRAPSKNEAWVLVVGDRHRQLSAVQRVDSVKVQRPKPAQIFEPSQNGVNFEQRHHWAPSKKRKPTAFLFSSDQSISPLLSCYLFYRLATFARLNRVDSSAHPP